MLQFWQHSKLWLNVGTLPAYLGLAESIYSACGLSSF